MKTKVQIAKLNNKNYYTWKYKIELLLIKEKVWNTISQATPSPITDKWTEQNDTARALIGLNVEDNQLVHIRDKKTAKDAWNKLTEIHENDSVTSLVTLIREMYATRMEEGVRFAEPFGQIDTFIPKNHGYG